MSALMEMKHLGLTLRATVYAQSPGAGVDWASCSMRTGVALRVCVCVSVHQHKCACIQCIYDGMGPWGEAVPCEGDPWGKEGEGEATCLLAVAKWGWQPSTCLRTLSLKTPSAHPLWDISSPGDPVTLTVFQLTGPPVHCPQGQLKLPPFTSDQRPFWATVIQYNTWGAVPQTFAVFPWLFLFCFKVIQAPRPYVSRCTIRILTWLSHHR